MGLKLYQTDGDFRACHPDHRSHVFTGFYRTGRGTGKIKRR